MGNYNTSKFRNFIFGVEDSLVSTVGLLSGVAIAGIPASTLVLTGIILIFVEAFSMAAGSFLSEHSAEEFSYGHPTGYKKSFGISVVMFFSYFISGFIPLAPYLFLSGKIALFLSVGLSLVALFILGMVSGRMSSVSFIKSGLKMAFIGGIAIAVGILVSRIIN